jgi:hypothetical protein
MSDLPPGTPTDLPPDGDGVGGTPPSPKRRGLTAAIIVLGVVVLALIIALVWLLVANAKPATPTPTPTATPTASPTTTRPTPTSTTTPTSVISRCTVDQLSVTLGAGNGAAGSEIVPILFTNTGSTPCELHGYPGVSFVGDGNGTQLGAAADEDGTVAIVANTLKPGGVVQARLKIASAQNFDNCTVVPADGLRVYPPHSFDSVFVKATGMSACSNAAVHLLTVQPVVPQ